MKEFLFFIEEIVQFGLHPNIAIENKKQVLERALVNIYKLFFELQFSFDSTDYPDAPPIDRKLILQNIRTNFPDFGYYSTILDIEDLDGGKENFGIGDAIDDLEDIIVDLLEAKQMIQTNSEADGLWHFNTMFGFHTQEHLINLLAYMKEKKTHDLL